MRKKRIFIFLAVTAALLALLLNLLPGYASTLKVNWGISLPVSALWQETYRDAADDCLDSIQVPQEQRPDYDSCAFWYASQEDNSQVILFWNPDAKKLYVAESFI